ncbi:hypothetical protein ACFQHO_40105 [Actinomadura yumaensis]|uniref:hypothetical protein n=1 Tax=Actinomadura yumaensis TaxID=111807 RepID=UPI00360BE5F1
MTRRARLVLFLAGAAGLAALLLPALAALPGFGGTGTRTGSAPSRRASRRARPTPCPR